MNAASWKCAQNSHVVIVVECSHSVIYSVIEVIKMRIREIRQQKGMLQKELAAKLGIAANTLSQYETGNREPDIETTKKIAAALNVTLDELVGATEKAPSGVDGRSVSDDDIKFALFGGGGEITDEMYDEVKRFAHMVKLREEAERKKE